MPKNAELIYKGFWFSPEREERNCSMAGHVLAIFIFDERFVWPASKHDASP
jgi:hypothetical protein